jgi:hypothetical protein
MKVMTVHFYTMERMMYGICVVLVIFWVCHFPFFIAALSITTLLL